jgi:uncharacterized coiled-coil DUF342 family protein
MVFKTMQDCADELNELVRQRNAVIKERDEARAEVARGDVAKSLLSQIDSALKAAGVPTLLTDIGAAERKPMLIRERVEWLTNQWLEAKRQMPEMQKNFDRVLRQRDEARAEVERLRRSFSECDNRIQQELGKAIGYPWYKDSQEHFPGATESNGVCVGDHVGETLAIEAASKIRELRAEVEKLKEQLRAEIKKNTITIPIRPEPSRLEIAADLLAGAIADPSVEGSCINHTWFLRQADALIAAAKEEQ